MGFRSPSRRPEAIAPLVAVAALGVHAAIRVARLAWTCDDAFISYRYAKHLVDGQGLVFNVGERVEGYTNFLFTILIAGAMRLGIDARTSSMALGAIAYFGVAALLCHGAYARGPRAGVILPVGAALWLIEDDLHTWATGGLETAFFALLVLGGIERVTVAEYRARNAVLGGTLLALACLTRPDGVVFAAMGVLGPLLSSPRPTRAIAAARLAAVAMPLVVVGGAFVAFKWLYYGRLLPTSFYAKSAVDPYYSQGLVYVALYFEKHWALGVALVTLPLAVLASGRARELASRRDALLALSAAALFAAYVAHSGGDYMFARRLVPTLPLLFVFVDAAVSVLRPEAALACGLAITVASFFPHQLFEEGRPDYLHGITDERSHYPEPVIAARREQAKLAQEVFPDLTVPAAFGGGMCMFAYFSELPYLVEPNGLTQYWIAERPLSRRGAKIGHEKAISLDALREHGVELIFHRDLPPLSRSEPRFDDILVGNRLHVQMLVYDDDLMSRLSRDPRVRFHRIDDVLREATGDLAVMSCADARASLEALSRYYLDRHPEKAGPLLRAEGEACSRVGVP